MQWVPKGKYKKIGRPPIGFEDTKGNSNSLVIEEDPPIVSNAVLEHKNPDLQAGIPTNGNNNKSLTFPEPPITSGKMGLEPEFKSTFFRTDTIKAPKDIPTLSESTKPNVKFRIEDIGKPQEHITPISETLEKNPSKDLPDDVFNKFNQVSLPGGNLPVGEKTGMLVPSGEGVLVSPHRLKEVNDLYKTIQESKKPKNYARLKEFQKDLDFIEHIDKKYSDVQTKFDKDDEKELQNIINKRQTMIAPQTGLTQGEFEDYKLFNAFNKIQEAKRVEKSGGVRVGDMINSGLMQAIQLFTGEREGWYGADNTLRDKEKIVKPLQGEYKESLSAKNVPEMIVSGLTTTIALSPLFVLGSQIGGMKAGMNLGQRLTGAIKGSIPTFGPGGVNAGVQKTIAQIKEMESKGLKLNTLDRIAEFTKNITSETFKNVMEPVSEIMLPGVNPAKSFFKNVFKKATLGVMYETGTEQITDVTGDLIDGTDSSLLVTLLRDGEISKNALNQVLVESIIALAYGSTFGAGEFWAGHLQEELPQSVYRDIQKYVKENQKELNTNFNRIVRDTQEESALGKREQQGEPKPKPIEPQQGNIIPDAEKQTADLPSLEEQQNKIPTKQIESPFERFTGTKLSETKEEDIQNTYDLMQDIIDNDKNYDLEDVKIANDVISEIKSFIPQQKKIESTIEERSAKEEISRPINGEENIPEDSRVPRTSGQGQEVTRTISTPTGTEMLKPEQIIPEANEQQVTDVPLKTEQTKFEPTPLSDEQLKAINDKPRNEVTVEESINRFFNSNFAYESGKWFEPNSDIDFLKKNPSGYAELSPERIEYYKNFQRQQYEGYKKFSGQESPTIPQGTEEKGIILDNPPKILDNPPKIPTENAIKGEDNNKSAAFDLFKKGKKNSEVLTALNISRAEAKKVVEWRDEFEKQPKTTIQKMQDKRKENIIAKSKPLIDEKLSKGYKPESENIEDVARRNQLQSEYDRTKGSYPIGNKEHPETKRFNEVADLLKGDIKRPDYRLVSPDGSIYKVNKTEYDYAISQSETKPTSPISEPERTKPSFLKPPKGSNAVIVKFKDGRQSKLPVKDIDVIGKDFSKVESLSYGSVDFNKTGGLKWDTFKEISKVKPTEQMLYQKIEPEEQKELWYNNLDGLTPYEWDEYARTRRGQGYDVKNGEDGKRLIEERIRRTNKPITNADILAAFNRARGTYQKEIKPTTEFSKLFKTAKKVFGTTLNTKEAGYILPDGSMLDFSGKREGGTPNSRAFDHREVTRLYEEGISTDMEDFISNGAIRFMPENDGFYIKVPPTQKQRSLIAKILQNNDGYSIVEVGEGVDVFYKEYEKGTKPSEVLRDIDNYFAHGKNKSQVANIRNSPEFTGEGQELLQDLDQIKLKELADELELKAEGDNEVELEEVIRKADELIQSGKIEQIINEGETYGIDEYVISEFEKRSETEVKQLEPIVKDIERKAASDNEVELNEAIVEASKIIREFIQTTEQSINKSTQVQPTQSETRGNVGNEYVKEGTRIRKVFEKMDDGEQKKFLRIVANGFLSENPDIKFGNVPKETGQLASAVANITRQSIMFDPRTADMSAAIEEINHIVLSNPALVSQPRAERILKENGWDGKGDYRTPNQNKTLEDAYENFADKNKEWYSKDKDTEPKILTEKFIVWLKNLWNKLAGYLHGKGFYTQAGFFENLYTGRLKEMAVKDLGKRLQEINPEAVLTQGNSLGQSFSPIWYSKLERVIEQKAQNKNLTLPQVMALLKNNGVKDEEIKWLDIEGFFKNKKEALISEGLPTETNPKTVSSSFSFQSTPDQLKPARLANASIDKGEFNRQKSESQGVTKKDLLDWIKANQIEIEEITRGEKVLKQWAKRSDGYYHLYEVNGEPIDAQYDGMRFESKEELNEWAENYSILQQGKMIPKFSEWKTPGGKNYREVLFTLPGKTKHISNAESVQFKSPHWDEPNVFAHTRVNDREVDGKKYLHIEEVQSDWAIQGRKEGYKENNVTERIRALQKEKEDLFGKHPGYLFGDAPQKVFDRISEIETEQKRLDKIKLSNIPDFPFKNNWQEFVMKRMLRYAAENGYDGISWATGEQTADRYDLSKQVDKITLTDMGGGNVYVQAYKGSESVIKKEVKENSLSNFVGKDIAEKYINGDQLEFVGEDLKVGGEWATNLYDKQLVNFMDKYAKKWGAKVGTIKLEETFTPENNSLVEVHSININDNMRHSVLFEGQQLFQKLPEEKSKEKQEDLFKEQKKIADEAWEDSEQTLTSFISEIKKRTPDLNHAKIIQLYKETRKRNLTKIEKPTGLNKEEIKTFREELDLGQLDAPKRRSVLRSLGDAKERKLNESALELADEVIRERRPVDDAEHAGMVMKAKDLRDEYNSLTKDISILIDKGDIVSSAKLQTRRDVILDQLDKLTLASDYAGTELGRALNIRKMRVKGLDYDLASIMQRAKATKGSKLTQEETQKVEELAKRYEQSEKELNELRADYDKVLAEKEKLLAQKVTEREIRKTKITDKAVLARERIIKERTDIKKQLASLGFRLNDITGLTAEGSYWVGKLAVNYIKEGAVNLNEVVQKVLADLPDLTERDVYGALNSRDPNKQQKLKDDAYKRIKQIKKQAELLEDIKNAEEGIFKDVKKRPPTPSEITALRKTLTSLRSEAYRSELDTKRLEKGLQTINELQDQLANQRRVIKKRQPIDTPELEAIKEKIKELRKTMNLEDNLIDLREQLRSGEFKIKEKAEPKPLPPEIERKIVELNTLRKQIKNTIREMQPKTVKDIGIEVINTLRTAKASMDMSASLRQGAFVSARRPQLFVRTFGQSFQSFFSENTYEEIQHYIESNPNHYLRLKAGLELTDVNVAPNKREEMFQSEFLERVWVIKHGIKASNRHMVTTLNLLRVGVFDEFLEKYPNATQEELKAWADYVNVATGRGNLGDFTQAANKLSLGLFSPRFAVSRFQTPYMLFKHWSEPRVRKEIAKDYAAFAGLGATVLALASLAGFAVSGDPDDPDFGKIKVGNTRIDMFAGIQQPMRLLLRIGKVVTDKVGITKHKGRFNDPLEMLGRFSSYKASPFVTIPHDLLTGRNMIGQKVDVDETLLNAIVPMVYEDIYDAYKEGGISRATWTGLLNFYGMSVNTYEKKSKR